MNEAWTPPGPARLSDLEAELMNRAALIGSIYGVIVLLGLLILGWFALRIRREPLRWRDSLSRLYWRPWNLADVQPLLLLLVCAFVLGQVIQVALLGLATPPDADTSSRLLVLQSVLFHWLGLGALVVMLRRRRLPWHSAFGVDSATAGRDAFRGLLTLLGTMPILVGAAFIYNFVLQLFGFQPTLQDVAFIISDETSPWMRAYFVLLAVVIAPVFEELLFRGLLLPALARRYGAAAATLVISAVFAVIHGHLPSVVPLFILSVSLCLAYIGTGSLVASIVMHAVFNGVTVALLFAVD